MEAHQWMGQKTYGGSTMEVGALSTLRGLAQARAKANEKAAPALERAKENQEREVAASNEEARASATGSGRWVNRAA
jgi:hypothetical protein